MGKAAAILSNSELRKKDVLNISLDDGRQLAISDQTPGDLTDPGTDREITGCSWTLYSAGAQKLDEGHNATMAYQKQGLAYVGLAIEIPAYMKLTQDGAMVPDPPPSAFSTLRLLYVEVSQPK